MVLRRAVKTIPNAFVKLFGACLEKGVFPKCWKEGSIVLLKKGEDKDETDPRSYRPICLRSVVGKLFEKLLNLRLRETVLANEGISKHQFGFMPERSTEDAICELRSKVNELESRYVLGILFDIKGAFDNVLHPVILEALRVRECPANVYSVMQDYFRDRKVRLSWGHGKVEKEAFRGCPQGSVLGPTCWILAFDSLLSGLNEICPAVGYADDLIALVTGESRVELEVKAQGIVDRVLDWSKSVKLQISESKTEGIFLKIGDLGRKPIGRRGGIRPDRARKSRNRKANPTSRNPVIKIGKKSIKIKETVRYLGIHIDKGMKFISHCKYLRSKVAPLFGKMRRLARTNWGLKFKTTFSIYKAVFMPTITYAAAAWADSLTVHDIRTLKSAQHASLIAVTRAYRTASTDALCVVTRVPDPPG